MFLGLDVVKIELNTIPNWKRLKFELHGYNDFLNNIIMLEVEGIFDNTVLKVTSYYFSQIMTNVTYDREGKYIHGNCSCGFCSDRSPCKHVVLVSKFAIEHEVEIGGKIVVKEDYIDPYTKYKLINATENSKTNINKIINEIVGTELYKSRKELASLYIENIDHIILDIRLV